MKSNTGQGVRQPARYDRVAPHYDRAMRPLERWLLARLRAKVFASLPEDARLLEVGAGTGANFDFYPRGTRGTASELSHGMLRLARGKESSECVQLVQSCAEKLPFADASFDAAVATLVLCSVSSPEEAFGEMRRVVRAGGTIALLEHVRPNGLLGMLFDALNVLTVPLFDDHLNRRTADEARRAGFDVMSVERHALGIINIILVKNSLESGVWSQRPILCLDSRL